MNMSYLRATALAVGVASALTAGQALALSSVTSLLYSDGATLEYADDDSVEWMIGDSDNLLEQGERLRGVFGIQQFNYTAIGDGTNYNELTGVFDATVLFTQQLSPTSFVYAFGPTATALSGFSAAGTMVEIYEDASQNFTTQVNPANTAAVNRGILQSIATDGNHVLSFGMLGDVDEYWVATTRSNNISVLSGLAPNVVGGQGDFALSLIQKLNGWASVQFLDVPSSDLLADAVVDGDDKVNGIIGNVSIYAPNANQKPGADVKDDADIYFKTVPEPTTMMLLGSGLLGAAFSQRRRKK